MPSQQLLLLDRRIEQNLNVVCPAISGSIPRPTDNARASGDASGAAGRTHQRADQRLPSLDRHDEVTLTAHKSCS